MAPPPGRHLILVLLGLASLSLGAAPPEMPQAVTGVANGTTVTLTWQAPGTGSVPTGYVVEAALSAGGATIASLTAASSPLVVPDVPHGTYYIRVRSLDGSGPSLPSNEVVVTVPGGGSDGGGCASPPNAPQNLTGSVAAGGLVSLAWSPPLAGCAAASYTVHAGSFISASNIAQVGVGSATSLSASAPAGTYYIRVVAVNPFGISAPSNEAVLTIGSACQLPGAPTLSSATVAGSVATLNWLPPAGSVTGYRIEAGSAPTLSDRLTAVATFTSYLWQAAPPGTSYVRVRALNACGVGPASNEILVTASAVCPVCWLSR